MSDLGNNVVMANNIKKYLQKSGKSQKEFCKILNFKESTFSDWITGKKYPRIDKIELMANYFGISKAALIENDFINTQLEEFNLSEEEAEMIKKYRLLDADGKNEINLLLDLKVSRMTKNA